MDMWGPNPHGATDGGAGGTVSVAGFPCGELLPINLQGPTIPDKVPSDKIRDVAQDLPSGRVGGASKMHAEDIKR